MVVHLSLGVGPVLLAKSQQIQALLKRAYEDLDKTFNDKALLFVFYNDKLFLQPHIRLVEQVIELVIVNLKVGTPDRDLYFGRAEHLDLTEQVVKTVDQNPFFDFRFLLPLDGDVASL